MKNLILYVSLCLVVLSCGEPKPVAQEKSLPSSKTEGNWFFNITKSPYYPSPDRPVEQMELSYGEILIDSADGYKIITAKMWSKDSSFKRLAHMENLKHNKKFYIDTTTKERLSDFEHGFEVKNISNDTAYFRLKVKDVKVSSKELEEKWSIAIHHRFENETNETYDTVFFAWFKSPWITIKE